MCDDTNKPERLSSIFDSDVEKVYSVGFMEYTDYTKEAVAHNTEPGVYLFTGGKPFLVRESELLKYVKYGKGYEFIDFVGMITKSDIDVNTITHIQNTKEVNDELEEEYYDD